MSISDDSDQGQSPQDFGTVGGGGNPMYAEYLENIPEDYRDEVEGAFKEWDANVTRRFQALGEELAPYKELIENYDPRVLTAGINLLSKIAEDPQQVYNQLAEAYNFGNVPEEGESPVAETQDEWQARIEQQQIMLEELQNTVRNQQQRNEEQNQIKEFENYLETLRETKGDFDDDYVLSKVAAGFTPEQAIESFHELISSMSGDSGMDQPPIVLGSSSGVENADIDFNTISDKDTKDIVAQMLKQANS